MFQKQHGRAGKIQEFLILVSSSFATRLLGISKFCILPRRRHIIQFGFLVSWNYLGVTTAFRRFSNMMIAKLFSIPSILSNYVSNRCVGNVPLLYDLKRQGRPKRPFLAVQFLKQTSIFRHTRLGSQLFLYFKSTTISSMTWGITFNWLSTPN